MPAGMKGWSMVRLTSLTLRLACPASCSRRLASARAFSISRPTPGSCSSSDIGNDQDAPGRNVPPTPLIREILPRDSDPPQRSIANVSAWRTRRSSNGLRSVLKVRRMFVLATAQPVHHGVAAHEDCLVSVKIGTIGSKILIEPDGTPVRAFHIRDELERTRSHHLRLGIPRVLLELLGAVDAVER